MAKVNKKTFVFGAIWKMLDSLCLNGISVVVSIILARILMPEAYGVIGLTTIFINLANFVVQSGLGTALVQKKEVDNVDYTTVFFFCLFIAALCYAIFYIAAPHIASFYEEPQLTKVLRVQMLSLFLCAFGVVRGAIMTRKFMFRASFIVNVIATIISGALGIWFAYIGFGVWALVFHSLIRDGLISLILFFYIKWKPTLQLSFKRMKALLSFSSWVFVANILDFLGNNIPGTIYGKHYSVTTVGYLSKGSQLPQLVCLHTFGAISGVLLPAMAESQNDHQRLIAITRKIVSMSAYILLPMMAGLALVSERVVIFLFTEKWLPCVPLMVASCISFGVNPFRSVNMQLIYALGHAKKAAIIEIIRFAALIATMLIFVFGLKFSLYTVSYIGAGISVLIVILTQCFTHHLIGYRFKDWFSDLLVPIFMTAIMGIAVYFAGKLTMSTFIVMAIQMFVGIVSYLLMSIIIKPEGFRDILDILKNIVKR